MPRLTPDIHYAWVVTIGRHISFLISKLPSRMSFMMYSKMAHNSAAISIFTGVLIAIFVLCENSAYSLVFPMLNSLVSLRMWQVGSAKAQLPQHPIHSLQYSHSAYYLLRIPHLFRSAPR